MTLEQLKLIERRAARKRNAKPQPTPRERVLSQARPTVVENVSADVTARPIGEYIAKLRASVEQV